jgi:hypothetical protein
VRSLKRIYRLADETSFGPFGLVAEIVIVALGALGVAAMFQDYAYFHRPEAVTLENVALKYCAVVVATIVYAVLIRKRRKERGR